MSNVATVKKEVDKIKRHVNPEHKGCAWAEEDGTFKCDGQEFKDETEFRAYVRRVGYTKMFVVGLE